MNPIRSLFSHYRSYHEHGPLLLRYMSILGFAGFPTFYVLRFTKSTQTYDDLNLRVIDAVLCLALFLKNRWPDRLKPYYYAYSYLVLVVALPFTFTFTSLKHGGGTIAVGNTLMAVFLLILLTDWRNTLAMLAAGTAAAVLLYMGTDPQPRMPVDYLQRLPILVVALVGGILFKIAGERAAAARVRSVYASLAGSIAHEMRNPLSQIKHSLERMQRALPLPTTQMQAQTISGIEVDALYRHLAQSELSVKRGLQVISMTLDEVNDKPIDASAFSYISAAEATDKAVREYGYEDDAERGRVLLRVREDFNFRGDETAFLFVLFNLLRNALYYVGLNADAQITVTVERQKVAVHDNGPGIAPELLARLFEPFSSAGKSGGTGLGLVYCRRVMNAFGGRIECDSVPGQYTQFILHFPVVTAGEAETHRLAVLGRAREAFIGKRILVADDDAAQRLTTHHKLLPLGAAIDEAADGRRALDMLARERYDIVLLDLNMPVLDGYAVAEQLRRGQAPASKEALIVAYTSEPPHLAGVKTHKAGMDGFISKPCAQLQLVQSLQYMMERRHVGTVPGAQHLTGRKVLLADDSPVNRKAVAAWLRHAGAEVTEVGHGQAVLDQLQQAGPCGIL